MNPTTSLLSLSLLACAASCAALEQPGVGPRALGMGGAGVACSDDYVAQFYNPAAFGFFGQGTGDQDKPILGSDNQNLERKDWGVGIDLMAGARIGGDLIKYADTISNVDVDKLQDIEHEADISTHEIYDKLNRTFITPLEPACVLVYTPGRYRFWDFAKVGAILTVIVFAISLYMVPIFWPF